MIGQRVADMAENVLGEWQDVERLWRRWTFGWSKRAALYRHLATQVSNGIAEEAALDRYAKRLRRRRRHGTAEIIGEIRWRVTNGYSISEALRTWATPAERMAIAGGEQAGKLPLVLELLLGSRQRVSRIRRGFLGAIAMPIAYIVVIYGVLWTISAEFVPAIARTAPHMRFTGAGGAVIELGRLATSAWALLPAVGLAALIGAFIWSLPNWTGTVRRHLDQYLPYSFFRDVEGYVWLVTFATMLRAGTSDTKILKDQAALATPWLRERLTAFRHLLEDGTALGDALADTGYGFPNPELIEDIASMADFPDFVDRITARVNTWSDEIEWKLTAQLQVMGFVFDIIVYLFIGWFLYGITGLLSQIGSVHGV